MEDIMDEHYWLSHPDDLDRAAKKAKEEFLEMRERYMEMHREFNLKSAKKRRLYEMDTRVKRTLACKRAKEAGVAAPCFEGLPAELRHYIFSYLGMPDVYRCKQVCRDWADVVDTGTEADARFGKVPDQILPINKYLFAREIIETEFGTYWDASMMNGIYRGVASYLHAHNLTKRSDRLYIHNDVAYLIAKTRRTHTWELCVQQHLVNGVVAIPDKQFVVMGQYVVLQEDGTFWIIDITRPARPKVVTIAGWAIIDGTWLSDDKQRLIMHVKHHIDRNQSREILELDPATATYQTRAIIL